LDPQLEFCAVLLLKKTRACFIDFFNHVKWDPCHNDMPGPQFADGEKTCRCGK